MTSEATGLQLFTADHVAEETKASGEADELDIKLSSAEELNEYFEVERSLKWIKENSFKRVALQLPDNLLKYAFDLADILETQSSARQYVLADTSYRSCCVDDVAAEHAKCDALIHYGNACLSQPSGRIPVLYVFGQMPCDIAHMKECIQPELSKESLSPKVVLLYDSVFHHCAGAIEKAVVDCLPSSSLLTVCSAVMPDATPCSASQNVSLGRTVPEDISDDTSDSTLIFVGSQSSPLLSIWLMTYIRFTHIVHYSPYTRETHTFQSSSQKQLRKRLFLIEKVRDANTVGLVVGTLGIQGYNDAIARVRSLCKEAHKKLYVFSIGKINEAKLSNFSGDIDAFILLSCPFGIILDSSDFFKPIVSLFEAEIALNADRSWFSGSGWTAQLDTFAKDPIGKFDDNAVDVSLVSGKVRALNFDENSLENDQRQIVEYSAGDYFTQRTWKGLDDTANEGQEDLKLKEGLSGIASGYSTVAEGGKK
jgi:diphthamide biosynthesis protein 2